MKKLLLMGGGILFGLLFVFLAVLYWITPAENLPTFMPGYEAGVITTHFKHGLASLIVGLLFFIFAWFGSGKKEENEVREEEQLLQQ
jgi:hypothetical protein